MVCIYRRTDSNISFDSQADERSSDLSSEEAEESEGQEARVYSHKAKQGPPRQVHLFNTPPTYEGLLKKNEVP